MTAVLIKRFSKFFAKKKKRKAREVSHIRTSKLNFNLMNIMMYTVQCCTQLFSTTMISGLHPGFHQVTDSTAKPKVPFVLTRKDTETIRLECEDVLYIQS